jgi:hypothetical protein
VGESRSNGATTIFAEVGFEISLSRAAMVILLEGMPCTNRGSVSWLTPSDHGPTTDTVSWWSAKVLPRRY